MAKAVSVNEPNLPWVDHSEDRSFKLLVIIMLLLFLSAGFFLNLIKLPEIEQKNLVDVSPRLAKLIMEKQKVKPPPPPPLYAPGPTFLRSISTRSTLFKIAPTLLLSTHHTRPGKRYHHAAHSLLTCLSAHCCSSTRADLGKLR